MSEEQNLQPQIPEVTSDAQNLEAQEEQKQVETTTEEKPQEEQVDYSKVETAEDATKILKTKGLDYDEITKEFEASGDLSLETYKKLEDAGIPREFIDAYKDNQIVRIQKTMEDIASVVGGVDNMTAIVNWAKANLSAEEKQSIDAIHDPTAIKFILKSLEAKMNDTEGILPQQILGGAGEPKADYFESMAEVEDAINDPRYSRDPVYRAKVGQKISASREAGVLDLR